jgi:hypothetical protein
VRIFLSYASERRAAAEPIALALRGRGHAVFFDKDDPPGAESYDAQIETAVGESDLMIFLISPESVEPGRYTLTELAFARHRWRSARGRVLPVLIAPTPLERTPAYLTSVQILKPEGNAAAEVASFVDGIIPVAKVEHALPLAAALGVASGMVSGGVDLFAPLNVSAGVRQPANGGFGRGYRRETPLSRRRGVLPCTLCLRPRDRRTSPDLGQDAVPAPPLGAPDYPRRLVGRVPSRRRGHQSERQRHPAARPPLVHGVPQLWRGGGG